MKLTKAMIACLEAMAESNIGISYYDAARLGGNGWTLSRLVDRDFATATKYANGKAWNITEAGRRAIEAQENTP